MECEEGLACASCGRGGQPGSSRVGLLSRHKLGTKDNWERTHFHMTRITVKNSRGFICISKKDCYLLRRTVHLFSTEMGMCCLATLIATDLHTVLFQSINIKTLYERDLFSTRTSNKLTQEFYILWHIFH